MNDTSFTQTNTTFAMACGVAVNIEANAEVVWGGFVPLFKGVRTFELKSRDDGSTDFWMEERFSGILFALTRRMLPDFRPIFEAYAGDLKSEAERIGHTSGQRSLADA